MVVSSASIRGGRGGTVQEHSWPKQLVCGDNRGITPVGFAHLRSGIDGHGLSEGISVAEGK